jgi:hypothetical protein
MENGSHCKLQVVKNRQGRIRNYNDAIIAHNLYNENCKKDKDGHRIKNPKMSQLEIIASQTSPPNIILQGYDNYLHILPPDGLHWWLGCIRVRTVIVLQSLHQKWTLFLVTKVVPETDIFYNFLVNFRDY